MRNIKLLAIGVFLGILFSLIACNSDEVSWQKTADEVFEYKHFTAKNNQPNLSFGDSVQLHCVLKHKDRELFSSYKEEQPIEIFIPDRMHRNKIEDLLVLMGEGDSLVAKVQYEDVKHELKEFGQNLEMNDELEIHYTIVSVRSRETIKQEQERSYAQKKGFQSREAMLEERAYIVEKSKWIKDTLNQQLGTIQQYLPKLVDKGTVLPYYVNEGDGQKTKAGQKAYIYYVLMLAESGKVLDDAYNRADRLELVVEQDSSLINGLHQATLALQEGGKGTFLIPPTLAYGNEGSLPVVPANAWLVAYVELVELKD